jgi:hypothetical protein
MFVDVVAASTRIGRMGKTPIGTATKVMVVRGSPLIWTTTLPPADPT